MQVALTVWRASRPPFLLLTLIIMLLLASLAVYEGYRLSVPLLCLLTLGALAAHMSVNLLNEYEDAQSGLDNVTQRTPFSGGSGALQSDPSSLPWVAAAAYFLLGFVVMIGLFLMYLRGWMLLPIGLVGVMLIVGYTRYLTHMPWMCLIAPGLAFGPLMIWGGYFVLTGQVSELAFLVSWIPFLLVNNLLLLNQFPDVEADKTVGRFNLFMSLGQNKTLLIFKSFLVLSYLWIVLLILENWLPFWAGLSFISLIFALPLLVKVKYLNIKHANLSQVLALNVMVVLFTPMLLGLGLLFAAG